MSAFNPAASRPAALGRAAEPASGAGWSQTWAILIHPDLEGLREALVVLGEGLFRSFLRQGMVVALAAEPDGRGLEDEHEAVALCLDLESEITAVIILGQSLDQRISQFAHQAMQVLRQFHGASATRIPAPSPGLQELGTSAHGVLSFSPVGRNAGRRYAYSRSRKAATARDGSPSQKGRMAATPARRG